MQVLSRQVNIEICELLETELTSRHEGNHQIGRSLAVQIITTLYFWRDCQKSTVQTGMTKSPTFGHLNTDRIAAPKFNQQELNTPAVLFPVQIQNNPSL